MNKAYFAYIRVSTVKQGEKGVSLAEQRDAIQSYATRNDLVIAKWFEEMETAAKYGRRKFGKMLSQLRAGKARGLLVHKIDRSARNLRDWADISELIDQGVDVRYVNDNFDLTSTGGRLSADIIAAVSASYVRNLREEVKKGLYGRLKQGLFPWQAPLGYLDQGGGKPKIIDPVRGPLVRRMFERYGTNTVSFRALRREMFELGLRTPSGKQLTFDTIAKVLHNPFYMGVIRLGTTGEVFAGVHEPLVSRALFERVQDIAAGKTVPRTQRHEFLFRQMVRCENCGRRRLTGELQKGRHYYRCHGDDCGGLSWRQTALEEIAINEIRRVRFQGPSDQGDATTDGVAIGDIGDLRDIIDDISRERQLEAESIQAPLRLRVQQIDVRITKLTDLLIDEAIDRDTFNARKEQLVVERRGAEERLGELTQAKTLQQPLKEFERNNRRLLSYESMTAAEKRELLEIVCSNFSVSRKSAAFTLRSPYREIAKLEMKGECGPERSDVTADRVQQLKQILRRFADGDTLPQSP